jgi:hypothetical protein
MQALQHVFHDRFFQSDWIIAPKSGRGAAGGLRRVAVCGKLR